MTLIYVKSFFLKFNFLAKKSHCESWEMRAVIHNNILKKIDKANICLYNLNNSIVILRKFPVSYVIIN
jgi:hypothetical protein